MTDLLAYLLRKFRELEARVDSVAHLATLEAALPLQLSQDSDGAVFSLFDVFLRSINGDTAADQSIAIAANSGLILADNGAGAHTIGTAFSVGAAGTDFAIGWHGGSSTLRWNLPDASPTARGVVNTTTQHFEGLKTFHQLVTTYGAGFFIDVSAIAGFLSTAHIVKSSPAAMYNQAIDIGVGAADPAGGDTGAIGAHASLAPPRQNAGGTGLDVSTRFTIQGHGESEHATGAYAPFIADDYPAYCLMVSRGGPFEGTLLVGQYGTTMFDDEFAGGLLVRLGDQQRTTVHLLDPCDNKTKCITLPRAWVNEDCACGSGSGSGSGSGGGGGISRASLGTAEAVSVGTLTIAGVTLAADTLLVVNIWELSGPPTGVTFNGTALSMAVVDPNNQASIWYLAVDTQTTGDIVATFPASDNGQMSAVEVAGLGTRLLTDTAANSGVGIDPSIGPTSPTGNAPHYVQSFFGLGSLAAGTSWGNSYTDGGQDTTNSTEGYRILSASAQPDGKITNYNGAWHGVTAVFA